MLSNIIKNDKIFITYAVEELNLGLFIIRIPHTG